MKRLYLLGGLALTVLGAQATTQKEHWCYEAQAIEDKAFEAIERDAVTELARKFAVKYPHVESVKNWHAEREITNMQCIAAQQERAEQERVKQELVESFVERK